VRAVALELDRVLGDTRPLWRDWLADVGRRAGVAVDDLPADRVAAAVRLDELVGNWRALLHRFAEDHAPVYLRPAAEVSAALRRLSASGVRVGVFTDAPEELARVALAHLGAARRVEAVAAGEDALERLLAQLGRDARIVRTREELSSPA
jgi:phosphoglycolate phosphatase-like HAD superfamily hydrolase